MLKITKAGKKLWAAKDAQNDNADDISVFDVKDLYDRAYAERDKALEALRASQTLLAQAQGLDAAYRVQLKAKAPYACIFPWRAAS